MNIILFCVLHQQFNLEMFVSLLNLGFGEIIREKKKKNCLYLNDEDENAKNLPHA